MPTSPSFTPPAPSTVAARMRDRWVLSLVGVAALLIALGLGLGFGMSGGGGDAGYDVDFDQREVVNRAGGYRLTVPQEWQSTVKSTNTQITAPDNGAIITVGLGPKTPLPAAAGTFFLEVKSRFSDVRTIGVQPRTIGGAPARVFAGVGTGEGGDRVRFLAITIKHQPANYVIVVRADNSRVRQMFPKVNSVVATFESIRS